MNHYGMNKASISNNNQKQLAKLTQKKVNASEHKRTYEKKKIVPWLCHMALSSDQRSTGHSFPDKDFRPGSNSPVATFSASVSAKHGAHFSEDIPPCQPKRIRASQLRG